MQILQIQMNIKNKNTIGITEQYPGFSEFDNLVQIRIEAEGRFNIPRSLVACFGTNRGLLLPFLRFVSGIREIWEGKLESIFPKSIPVNSLHFSR